MRTKELKKNPYKRKWRECIDIFTNLRAYQDNRHGNIITKTNTINVNGTPREPSIQIKALILKYRYNT